MPDLRATLAMVIGAALPLAGPALAQDRPELVVYAYESFTSEWGPGPAIAEKFEAVCGCDVRFVGAGDGAALMASPTPALPPLDSLDPPTVDPSKVDSEKVATLMTDVGIL